MRVTLLVTCLLASFPATAQMVVPLTTPDGRVACTQGLTGLGRPADWQGVQDADAPDGWALAEMARDPDPLRFPLCISEQAVGRDLDATLRFKPVAGTRARVAGLVFRAQGGGDYYVARADALDNTVRLYRLDKGKRSQLGSKAAGVEADKWHSLRVVAVLDRIEVSLDGTSLFNVTDRGILVAGALGVWSQADSVTHFGSFLVGPPLR
jgi:hypothetical protein